MSIRILAAAAVIAVAAGAASAATVTFGATPTSAQLNPIASSASDDVKQNFIESVNFQYLSPWEGVAGVDDDNSPFTSVGANSSATYTFDATNAISFLWGSPDDYNYLDIIFSGTGVLDTINGRDALPIGTDAGEGAHFVTITSMSMFDSVTFRSDRKAFEFANLTIAAVPLPAGVLLLGTALAGLGIARRRKTAA